MRFFFRSKQFKIILVVAVSLLLLSIISFAIGGVLSPQSNILGMLTAPLRTAATEISNSIRDIGKAYSDNPKNPKITGNICENIVVPVNAILYHLLFF